MGRLLKWVVIGLTVLVLVLAAAAVAVVTLVDPDEYRDEIAKAVEQATGRPAAIEGGLSLSLVPWLGVEVRGLTLGNPAGFSDQLFASAGRAELRAEFWPLLARRELSMQTVRIHGLQVNLERRADGAANWVFEGGEKGDVAHRTDGPAAGEGLAALAIGGLEVLDAGLQWRDEAGAQHVRVSGLELRTGAINGVDPVPLTLQANVRDEVGGRGLGVSISGELKLEPALRQMLVEALHVELAAEGQGVPGGAMTVLVDTRLTIDAAVERVQLEALKLSAGGAVVEGALELRGFAAPEVNGRVRLQPLDARALAGRLGVALPAMADADALTQLALNASLAGSATALRLEPLHVELDGSRITGRVEITDFATAALDFDLNVDRLDVDRYLPPADPAGGPAAKTPGAATASAAAGGKLDLAPLRALALQGRLAVGELSAVGLKLSEVLVTVAAKDGLIRLRPLTARLYGGRYDGNISLDARGEAPAISIDETLAGVQAAPLLKDLTGDDPISGTADATARLTLRGADEAAVRRSLNGTARFDFRDGAVNGINVGRMIREARAQLQGQTLPPGDEPLRTDFAALGGSVTITDGLVVNRDLAGKSPLLRVSGEGQAHLVSEELDYRLSAVLVGTAKGQGGKEAAELKGVEVPILVTGTFAAPNVTLDVERLLRAQAEAVVEAKKAEVREKVEAKVEAAVEEKLGDGAKGLLKGLFQ